jgi:hypothetical protein
MNAMTERRKWMKARTRPVLPDGTNAIMEVLDSEQVSGSYGPQLQLKLKVISGKYKGFEFYDGSKLAKDPETKEVYVEIGGKAGDIWEAAFNGEYSRDMDHSPERLIGRRIMSRIAISGKKQDRNRLLHGSIGPDPGSTSEEDETTIEDEAENIPF